MIANPFTLRLGQETGLCAAHTRVAPEVDRSRGGQVTTHSASFCSATAGSMSSNRCRFNRRANGSPPLHTSPPAMRRPGGRVASTFGASSSEPASSKTICADSSSKCSMSMHQRSRTSRRWRTVRPFESDAGARSSSSASGPSRAMTVVGGSRAPSASHSRNASTAPSRWGIPRTLAWDSFCRCETPDPPSVRNA